LMNQILKELQLGIVQQIHLLVQGIQHLVNIIHISK